MPKINGCYYHPPNADCYVNVKYLEDTPGKLISKRQNEKLLLIDRRFYSASTGIFFLSIQFEMSTHRTNQLSSHSSREMKMTIVGYS